MGPFGVSGCTCSDRGTAAARPADEEAEMEVALLTPMTSWHHMLGYSLLRLGAKALRSVCVPHVCVCVSYCKPVACGSLWLTGGVELEHKATGERVVLHSGLKLASLRVHPRQ